MKKIKIAIISIYVIVFLLVTSITIFIVANTFRKNFEVYFKEPMKPKSEINITEKDIDQTIETLRKFKIIK